MTLEVGCIKQSLREITSFASFLANLGRFHTLDLLSEKNLIQYKMFIVDLMSLVLLAHVGENKILQNMKLISKQLM